MPGLVWKAGVDTILKANGDHLRPSPTFAQR
jgi:hypothetical protein